MRDYQDVGGLKVARTLYDFIADEVLPGTGVAAERILGGLRQTRRRIFAADRARNCRSATILQARSMPITSAIAAGRSIPPITSNFCARSAISCLSPPDFSIATENVDDEIALVPGPQLVVPVSNARYVLNAANARWGSLYEALYGTDAISSADGGERGKGYNKIRGARVVAWGREFLDASVPLAGASHKRCHSLSRRRRQARRQARRWSLRPD